MCAASGIDFYLQLCAI